MLIPLLKVTKLNDAGRWIGQHLRVGRSWLAPHITESVEALWGANVPKLSMSS